VPTSTETKHARFLRLAQRRLERAKDELRLVSQLCSPNYENTQEEAVEVVRVLDEDIRHVAKAFGVEYATRIGKGPSETTNGAQPIVVALQKANNLDEIAIVQVLEHLRAGRIEEVDSILRAAVTGQRVA